MKYKRIAGPDNFTLTADQVVGKYLRARKDYKEYRDYPNSPDFREVPAGQIVGIVDSWVQRGPDVWWQFKYTDGGYYYVKHEKNLFDESYLVSQFPNGELPPQPSIEIPTWATFGAAAFALYQATQPENTKYKILWQLAGFGGLAYGAAQIIGKVDFNPFD